MVPTSLHSVSIEHGPIAQVPAPGGGVGTDAASAAEPASEPASLAAEPEVEPEVEPASLASELAPEAGVGDIGDSVLGEGVFGIGVQS